ncbi:hypothetical protein [uncultured Aquimarina sp.]|uniref:hypothetical protein n=1 Tax=uncultured Aquimarina sp. TaxID=575652 RepID=UPI0026335541|nr:hypothetical protein [uncultured Aquimarina sp.]
MELDYIENINEFGENVVRLYNFDRHQVIKFSELIKDTIVNRKQRLDLSQVDFIENRNCNLILGLFKTDEGILSSDNITFYCALTLESYANILKLLEPFCEKETKGYQYLYDIDNPTDFLFSPAGTW